MALVPAGCFEMGTSEETAAYMESLVEELLAGYSPGSYTDQQPVHTVCFEEPFWIDVTEVTNRQIDSVGAGIDRVGDDCQAISSEPDQPRICVTWEQASTHCESRGGRLPAEAEWEYAARGPDGLIFPWGDEWDGSLVNYCDGNCDEPWADADIDDGYPFTAPVGSYPGAATWVGALDMSGNVFEWASDWWSEGYYATLSDGVVDPQGAESGDQRAIKSGGWAFPPSQQHLSNRTKFDPTRFTTDFGFRCAMDFEQ